MIKTARFCLFLSACTLLSTVVYAQQVYRCGKSYSEKPCSGAVVLDTSDTRSKAQKQASQKAIQRDKQLAKELEKSRAKEDALAQAGRTPSESKTKGKEAKPSAAKPKKKKETEKEFFTAAHPASAKKSSNQAAAPAP